MVFEMSEISRISELSVHCIRFDTFHITDNSKNGINDCYFGCIIKGRAVIEFEGREFHFSEGDLMHLPKGMKYISKWYGSPEVEFYSIPYSLVPNTPAPFFKKSGDFRGICQKLAEADSSWNAAASFYELYAACGAGDFITAPSPVRRAVQFMEENPAADYNVIHLAKLCNMSESSFYHAFRKFTGFSPVEYKNSVRCREAVRLLKTTEKSTEQICSELYFSSAAYLRRVLKKYIGKTPGEIRKNRANVI